MYRVPIELSVQTRVEVWENEKCCRNTEYMFCISFKKQRDGKNENNLLTLIIKI